MDAKQLKVAINTIMPFGKYAGRPLLLLPEPYLVWFKQQGFPDTLLGSQLAMMYEVKLNGLEPMLMPLLEKK
ncbi:putative quorum-sensing-regulated virulence factor [Pseudoalteromonas sp.]|uniref:putative quorum-sensing-regulated virulence factor n=1 Tax=Pseudoalteromonas sp. TaxID=53249 RepID=UPI00356B1988